MNWSDRSTSAPAAARPDPVQLLNALPQPVLAIDAEAPSRRSTSPRSIFSTWAARRCCARGWSTSCRFGSPVIGLVADAIANQATVNGYKLDVSTPRTGLGRLVDAFVSPAAAKRATA